MYIYSKKQGKCIHIVNPQTDKSFCKLENSNAGRRLTEKSESAPEGRRLCNICSDLQDFGSGPSGARPAKRNKSKDSEFYQSWEWAQLRFEVLRRFGPKCMCCGASARDCIKIVVDHIKPRRLYPELELEFSNMQVLCDLCNRGKGGKDETDFRDLHDELDQQAASHMKDILN